ncbi:MAG: hypothetical protein ORN85_09285, partial [Sediminibacterium sp.]|nr:hypothetical protein [Sediminibacterium sp.]
MKIIKFPLLVFLMLTSFWGKTQQQPTLVSTNKSIFKANDTLVLRGRNLFQIELKTIANQNPRYIPKLNLVTEVSGSSDSLYSFIIPANMQNTVYKIKGINTIANDTSINTFVIRVSNNSDSLGIIGWGKNDYDQLNFPVGLSKIVQISAGRYITLALTFDGTVVVWGTNLHGLNNIPSGLKNVVQVAAGDNLCLALKSDGTVVAWGENNYNQLNVPTGLNNIVQVAAGSYFSLALKSDGSITAWGNNIDGQTTIPPGLTNVVQVAAEAYTSLVLKSDSTVFGWGYNGESQTDTVGLSKVVQLATGFSHSLALKSDGNIVPKGNNDENQIVIPSGLRNVKQIAAGSFHSLAITSSDTIVAWGDNFYQQTNIPIGLNNVVDISSGPIADHSFAMYKLAVKTTVFNGTITNTTFFKTGDSVKITYQPNRGYELDSI